MKTLAKYYIELAQFLDIAQFDDPDDDYAAAELLSRSMWDCSADEQQTLIAAARELATESTDKPEIARYYESFADLVEYQIRAARDDGES